MDGLARYKLVYPGVLMGNLATQDSVTETPYCATILKMSLLHTCAERVVLYRLRCCGGLTLIWTGMFLAHVEKVT